MAPFLFPDTTVLINFAAVGRLDLLEYHLDGQGRWTQAVAHEVRKSEDWYRDLKDVRNQGWLGKPIKIKSETAQAQVEYIRQNPLGGRGLGPTKHLGEAQTFYLIKHEAKFHGAYWISDDRGTVTYAKKQLIPVRETIHVVSDVIATGKLSLQDGFALMQQMDAADRSLRLPASVDELRNCN